MTIQELTKHNGTKTSVVVGMLFVILFSFPQLGKAQSLDPKFQAVFIYGISRNINWSSTGSSFKIGVIGDNAALISELKGLAASRKINDKSVQVESLSSASGNLSHDIIFITNDAKNQLASSLANASKNTLVVTEFAGAIGKGSYLNFITKGNKMGFELNREAIDKTNLKVTDELLKLASSN